jgi:hypothetical protein
VSFGVPLPCTNEQTAVRVYPFEVSIDCREQNAHGCQKIIGWAEEDPIQRGLNVSQDEDITEPEGIFHGMPTPLPPSAERSAATASI